MIFVIKNHKSMPRRGKEKDTLIPQKKLLHEVRV